MPTNGKAVFTNDETKSSSVISYDNEIANDFNKYSLIQPRRYIDNSYFSAIVNNNSNSIDPLKVMASYHQERDSPPISKIEEQMRIINKKFMFAIKNKVIDLFASKKIMVIDNKEIFSQIAASIVCWKLMNSAGAYVVVNASPCFNRSIEDIDTKTLYGLLTWGTMVYLSHIEWAKVTTNSNLASNLSFVYSSLFYRTIDGITGIGITKLRKDFVMYALSKYFLIYLLGRAPSQVVNAIAFKNVELINRNIAASPTNLQAIEAEEYRLGEFAGVSNQLELYRLKHTDFIHAMSKFEWAIGKLNPRSFLSKATTSYGPRILMCIEDLGNFMGAMATHQAGCELVVGYTFNASYEKYGEDAMANIAQLFLTH